MKILHLCNDFAGSTVHAELYQRLDTLDVTQFVYCPIRDAKLQGRNFFNGENTRIIYSNILKLHHRLCFHLKINDILKDLEQKVNLAEVDCVHATTLFSDGAVALRLKRKYGIPYIVAVRNTDLNAFMRYAPHLWNVHRAVVREAEKVIFISPNLQNRFLTHHTLRGLTDLAKQKSMVLPNGINDFWLNHLHVDKSENFHPFSVIYVGKFDDNKNVLRLLRAFLKLKEKYPNHPFHFDLVGGDGEQESAVLQLVAQNPDCLKYHGKIFDKSLLMEMYQRNSIFAMVSKRETFGLVYIEALSQGLRVLFTRGEGIDGLFTKRIGEAVNAYSEDEISAGLEKMLLHPEAYEKLQLADFNEFDWDKISQTYYKIYQFIICNIKN